MIEVTISEYGFIGCDGVDTSRDKFVGKRNLEPSLFTELYDFWLGDKETQKVLDFENKNCLKATSYVGIIQTKSLSVEVLPKTYKKGAEDTHRHIFMEMLKPLLDINEVQISKADLSITKNRNIYEAFITLFVESMDKLIHRGLKSQYISREDNQYFLKGKLKFNEHIKQNYIHKERFFVEFDEYLPDRVENKLLKSTIQLLLKKTNNYDNKRALRQQLFIFDEVCLSTNHDTDISKINTHRGMEYYETPLRFAKVFLKHHSFSSLRGDDHVFALLFPMQRVFENYMEFVLENSKEELGIEKILVNGGKNEYLLSSNKSNSDKCKMARLQPDYLLKMKEKKDIVTDAKWKLFEPQEDENEDCKSANISPNDAYQIFAYLNYYDCEDTACLFVPQMDGMSETSFIYNRHDHISNGRHREFKIKIVPIDLGKTIESHHKWS